MWSYSLRAATSPHSHVPPGSQRRMPPSGREVASPPGEDGERVTKDRISLPQSFATQNPAPSSEGANTAVQTRRRHPVGGRAAERRESWISMIAGGNHTLIPNQPPASADPDRRKREADCLPYGEGSKILKSPWRNRKSSFFAMGLFHLWRLHREINPKYRSLCQVIKK